MSYIIESAKTHDEWNISTTLVKEYVDSLNIDLSFQNIDEELSSLKDEYGGSHGVFLLFKHNNEYVGCVGLRKLDDDVCEMKRLYLKSTSRGNGFGKKLVESIIEEGRKLNYKKMLLDTLSTMTISQSLYEKMGFKEIDSYRYNPMKGTKYYELLL